MVPRYRNTPDRPSLELGTPPFLTVPTELLCHRSKGAPDDSPAHTGLRLQGLAIHEGNVSTVILDDARILQAQRALGHPFAPYPEKPCHPGLGDEDLGAVRAIEGARQKLAPAL